MVKGGREAPFTTISSFWKQ